MPKSKSIEDYFPIELTAIRPGEKVSFSLHLYFERNQHIMLWKETGETISSEFIKKYLARGVTRIWLHKDDKALFEAYLDPRSAEKELQAAIGPGRRTPKEMAAQITAAITAQKTHEVEVLAQEMLRQSATPVTSRAQTQINERLRDAVEDILQSTLDSTRSTVLSQVMELWKLAKIDPDFEHAVEVATFAVLFAMAFGRIDTTLLGDLALAGLLHDVGIGQIPASLATIPWKSFTPEQLTAYAAHVEESNTLISELAAEVPPRVRALIAQHHEKFNGSGYPNQLRGFKVDDIAQLLSISDILHSFATGQWDGTRRTLRETFEMLETLEKSAVFPEYFNPDVFEAVIGWIRSVSARDVQDNAAAVVSEQTLRLMNKTA